MIGPVSLDEEETGLFCAKNELYIMFRLNTFIHYRDRAEIQELQWAKS